VKKKTSQSAAGAAVWDLPIRAFHWLLVLLIAAAWWTADHDQMQLHRPIGYAIAGLLAFRLWWGVAGASTARFTGFVRGPRTVARYAAALLRGRVEPGPPGHNPMGGWSVVALLSILVAEVGLGLFTVDVDGVESGPLADRVSFEAGRFAAHWHHWLFNGLLALIVLHLCAIAVYALRKDNLIGPMITGRKASIERGMQPVAPWRLVVGIVLAVLVAVALAKGLRL
jgi:cytochrome b